MNKTLFRLCLIVAAIFSLSLTLFFNTYLPIGLVILACSIYPLISAAKSKSRMLFLMAAADVLILAGMLTRRYSVRIVFALLAAGLWIALLILYSRAGRAGRSRGKKALGVLGWIVLGILVLVFGFMGFTGLFPDGFSRFTQAGLGDFPVDPEETYTLREDGVEVFADITYPSAYPNNSLTIYMSPENRALIFMIHGGGLVSGDKNSNQTWVERMLSEGFSVLSLDYALAPQCRYPAAIRQANEALTFVVENAETWGIDTDKIIFAGDSAGSQLCGQLCCLLTNPGYAREMGLTTAAETAGFRPLAYISMSGLVDFPDFEHTGVAFIDWLFHIWGASAMGDVDYAVGAAAREASVVQHVTADFVPTFASDANMGSFRAQGMRLVEKLEALGVPVQSYFPDGERLFHDYELGAFGGSESSRHTVDLQIAFINHLLERP